MKLNTKS